MNEDSDRIAVIGAGIAGLTARRHLAQSGFSVDTFDKGRGPGGRTSRRRVGEYQFDHGAQYFTARDEHFVALVEQWITEGTVALWTPRIGVLRDQRWTAIAGRTPRYVGVPGMNQAAKNLDLLGEQSGASTVAWQTRITTVGRVERKGGSVWSLTDETGRRYENYRAVIIAIPSAQALDMLADVVLDETKPDDVSQLPLRTMLTEVAFEPCWSVMTVFDPELPLEWDAAFIDGSALSWAARNNSKPERPPHDAWVLHAHPDWTRRYLEADREWVAGELQQEFFRATGLPPREGKWSMAHRWRYANPRNHLVEGYWWSDRIHLGFCGDWCTTGRVEGAFLSALTLVETAVVDLNRSDTDTRGRVPLS